MGFCPYITTKTLSTSVFDGTTTTYAYVTNEYPCPQNDTCQIWYGPIGDCGSKNPIAAAGVASPSTLLNEFLTKVDIDELDLTPLGISGDGIYGHDFMIDDEENIPIILNAANLHPEFNDTLIINRVEGTCSVTDTTSGWDSTSEWIYEVVATDGTSDFTTSLVTTSMYIVFFDENRDVISSHQITSVDDDITITINLGYHDTKPLANGNYSFIIDRKRITWEEYINLF